MRILRNKNAVSGMEWCGFEVQRRVDAYKVSVIARSSYAWRDDAHLHMKAPASQQGNLVSKPHSKTLDSLFER